MNKNRPLKQKKLYNFIYIARGDIKNDDFHGTPWKNMLEYIYLRHFLKEGYQKRLNTYMYSKYQSLYNLLNLNNKMISSRLITRHLIPYLIFTFPKKTLSPKSDNFN